uniref:Uncharacterized protein n=1 Tax=Anguilla anguilla TaxID=7936 RepID=A0A0E9WBF1_ANGAN
MCNVQQLDPSLHGFPSQFCASSSMHDLVIREKLFTSLPSMTECFEVLH